MKWFRKNPAPKTQLDVPCSYHILDEIARYAKQKKNRYTALPIDKLAERLSENPDKEMKAFGEGYKPFPLERLMALRGQNPAGYIAELEALEYDDPLDVALDALAMAGLAVVDYDGSGVSKIAVRATEEGYHALQAFQKSLRV